MKIETAFEKAKFTIALCGNPNSGKTTLYNLLTGANQKVGNWPGVTVERKIGLYKKDASVAIADTPGIYSLSPFTPDEQVAHKYFMQEKPDLILNVVDSTNLERNLFLTTQLLELDAPLVVALNMQDEAQAKGITIDCKKLEEKFGCKFFPISAAKKRGVDELMKYCLSKNRQAKNPLTFCAPIENALRSLSSFAHHSANRRWTTLKLAEYDEKILALLNLSAKQRAAVKDVCDRLQKVLQDDTPSAIARQRFNAISQVVSSATHQAENLGKTSDITQKIDRIVLNKWLAFPIFAIVLTLVFYLSMQGPGALLTSLIQDKLTPLLQTAVNDLFENSEWEKLRSLVVDGILTGVMSVVGFVPQIMLLFGFIAVLEASGYMSRVAFITDRLLNSIGLGGRSFVSMILGCGCSVPAIMATRTIKNTKERNATITLTPFMPCSAKLAVISFFTASILKGNALFAISFYFLSVLTVIVGGLVLKLFGRKEKSSDTFIMELPCYRAPTLRNVCKQMWERGKAFLTKAGTVIFAASVLLWLLQRFDFRFRWVETENSMLASIGKAISPVFYPLGFNDGECGWQFAIATLTGLTAKETVVTTLQILLPDGVERAISGLGAYSFVAYNLLTAPCVATISASFSEQGWKNGLRSVCFQICAAYVVSLTIYQLGSVWQNHRSALVAAFCLCLIALAIASAFRRIFKRKGKCGCCGCDGSNCNACNSSRR